MNGNDINKKLLDDLKNLHKIEAPKNFETELWRKINSPDEGKKKGFWDNFITPGKLAPAAIALASAVIIFFVVDGNSEVMEDPLNIEPRLRDDVYVTETLDEVIPKEETKKLEKEIDTKQKGVRQRSEKDNLVSAPEQDLDKMPNEILGSEQGLATREPEVEKSMQDSNFSDETRRLGNNPAPVVSTSSQEISRNSLNFMQRSLSTQEEQELKQLKLKVTNQKNAENKSNSDK